MDIGREINRLNILKEKLLSQKPSDINKKVKVLISVGYPQCRAFVAAGTGNTFDTAYKAARDKAVKFIKEKKTAPPWIKADLVTNEWILEMEEWEELASKIKKYYFQYGISLDDLYNNAFLPQEVNGGCLIKYNASEGCRWEKNSYLDNLVGPYAETMKVKPKAFLNIENINRYLKNVRNKKVDINLQNITHLTIFETVGFFMEEENCYQLSTEDLCRDRRETDLTPELIITLLANSADYLRSTVKENGRFIYGYFACYNKEVSSYNSIRHALGVYGMLETYLITRDETLKEPIKKALEYLINGLTVQKHDRSFVVDFVNNKEIRLGANAIAILAITKYLEIADEDEKAEYISLAKSLGEGILFMQNTQSGKFTHVLQYPDLNVVDEFRIVYYSGEAAFALMRLYGVDRDEKWLKAVQKAFDYFIDNNYWKYADHWLAYCTNELTLVDPDDKYFEFGLKNTFYKIDYIIDRLTTWPTFLEMLTAAYTMIKNIRKTGKEYLFEEYELDKFYHAMKVRANRQLNGIFFPELAMYFKSPETILNGVFIRHHTFRVRNDDVAHHLSGYCHYLTDVLLEKEDF